MDMETTTMGSGLDFATFINSAMKNCGESNDNMWGGNGLLWIFLLLLFGWGNNGFNNNGRAAEGNIDAAIERARANGLSDQAILEAVKGNQTVIQTLASTFNTDNATIQQSLNVLNSGVDKLSGQIGLNGSQVVNAIQLGNQNLIQQLMSCCCEVKSLVLEQANANRFATMEQTNTLSDRLQTGFSDLHNLIDTQTAQMNAGFQSVKDMMTQSKIDSLQAEVATLRSDANNAAQTSYLQNYVNSQVAPVQTAVNALLARVPQVPQPAYIVGNTTTCGANYAYSGCGCS
jgi:hypothetical protein